MFSSQSPRRVLYCCIRLRIQVLGSRSHGLHSPTSRAEMELKAHLRALSQTLDGSGQGNTVLACIHRKSILSVQQTVPNTKGRHVNESSPQVSD